MKQVVLANVPAWETDTATRLLDGAHADARPFGAWVAREHPDARVVSVMVHDRVRPDDLQALGSLEAVVTRSSGHDHLPVEWLRRRGVAAYHLGDYAGRSVAELAVTMAVTLLRRLGEAQAVTQGPFRGGTDAPRWDRSRLVGRHLAECTAGVVGTGSCGAAAARLFHAFGARVVGLDLHPDSGLAAALHMKYASSLEDMLDRVDVLSLHVPLTPQTRGMVGRRELERLPEGAVLVNTARGDVVDQDAVLAALRSGRLGGYAADVLPGEPDPPDLPRFRTRTDVLLTPHLGAHCHGVVARRYRRLGRIVEAVLAGRPDDVAALRVP